MKLLATLALTLLSWGAFAQNDITQEVAMALKKGDAAGVAAHFKGDVDMTIIDEEGVYSSADAKKALAAFFSSHQPTDFVIKHKGTSKLDDQYRIGDLTTKNGSFRVTFFMKDEGSVMKIEQLRIE